MAKEQILKLEENMDKLYVSDAIQDLWKYIARTNKYIDETAPWILSKEEKIEELKSVMFNLAEALRKIAILLTPYMPNTSKEILSQLGIDEKLALWDSLLDYDKIKPNTKIISQGKPLFVRLEQEEELEYIKSVMKGK